MTKLNYGQLRDRCERISRMMMDRAKQVGRESGCGPIPMMWHNAKVSAEYGHPWREVNYSLLRKAQWIEERSHQPYRILDALYRRKGYQAFDWK